MHLRKKSLRISVLSFQLAGASLECLAEILVARPLRNAPPRTTSPIISFADEQADAQDRAALARESKKTAKQQDGAGGGLAQGGSQNPTPRSSIVVGAEFGAFIYDGSSLLGDALARSVTALIL